MSAPTCAHCPPGTPAAEQRDMGSRIRGGVRQRVYAWLCDRCIAAEARADCAERERQRRG